MYDVKRFRGIGNRGGAVAFLHRLRVVMLNEWMDEPSCAQLL